MTLMGSQAGFVSSGPTSWIWIWIRLWIWTVMKMNMNF